MYIECILNVKKRFIFRCDSISRLGVWESVCLSVCVIKPNNGYIAKHGAIIEYTLNVYWMYIEYTLKYCKTWCNTYLNTLNTLNVEHFEHFENFQHFKHFEQFEHIENFEHLVIRLSNLNTLNTLNILNTLNTLNNLNTLNT